MTLVAVLDDYQAVAERMADWRSLPDRTSVAFFHDHLPDEDTVVERLAHYEVIVAMRERTAFTRSVLERLPRLRLLVTTGMRNAAIDLEAADENGVVVSGTPGSGGATTELAWALILGLVRHVPEEDAAVRAGGWQRTVGTDLAGSTLGLLGLGQLGGRWFRWPRRSACGCWRGVPTSPPRPRATRVPNAWRRTSCSPGPTCSACT